LMISPETFEDENNEWNLIMSTACRFVQWYGQPSKTVAYKNMYNLSFCFL
jgi:hypothetical protein